MTGLGLIAAAESNSAFDTHQTRDRAIASNTIALHQNRHYKMSGFQRGSPALVMGPSWETHVAIETRTISFQLP